MAYPPEPWHLRGRMTVSIWAVPAAELPLIPAELASSVRVVKLGKRGFVGTAWVAYQPGGDMTYNELLSAVLMRAGLRPRVTITHIWVDSADSRDGGRELWGIPKDLAEFTLTEVEAEARTRDASIAAATVKPGVRLPLRWPLGFRVTQVLAGKPKTTGVRATARLGFGRAAWQIPQDGPLAFLNGRRPFMSVVASDFRMRFGARARASRAWKSDAVRSAAERDHTRA